VRFLIRTVSLKVGDRFQLIPDASFKPLSQAASAHFTEQKLSTLGKAQRVRLYVDVTIFFSLKLGIRENGEQLKHTKKGGLR